MLDPLPELVERGRLQTQRNRNLNAFAKVKALQRGLAREFRRTVAIFAYDAAEVVAQRGDGHIIPNVERGKLLGEIVPVGVRHGPLREIVREVLGQKMVGAERLEGMIKNRRVAAFL